MKTTTIVGLALHLAVAIIATVLCGLFVSSVSLVSAITIEEFIEKYNYVILAGVVISALVYIVWQFVGRFLCKNDLINSRFNMRRNWIVLFAAVLLLQVISYFTLNKHYSQSGLYGVMVTISIFATPCFAYWISTAAASPSLFKFSAPWSRYIRPIFTGLYKK